ncbi:Receptor-type tyrosine-protein phosphatase delta, partial [Geodia barretti]
MTISWTLERPLTATGYTISYSNTNNTGCFTDSRSGITTSWTSYSLTGLEEGTRYSITVTATLTRGGTEQDTIRATTRTAVPSAPPSSVMLSVVSSTSIDVHWERPENCRQWNGKITDYTVRYGEKGGDQQLWFPSGDSSGGMITLSGLTKQTVYTIEVAARTSAGTGVYSQPQNIETPDDVFIRLNGAVIPKHGYVAISHIGYTDDNTALLCI